ncbi:hypothetical protein JL973_11435 [Klebsiella pneumoniae]|uniref:hypothetical protein n=1 Tax=Klebsiella pneumoniae TaxID=573 RepID=UPI0019242217|nr:hypothetical protein [Klebsiella pneumoniae]MBL1453028.1 hypothetical protein [Klebsiella pneumoniae]
MTTIAVKIETVSGAKVEFSREVFIWDELNQFERDDIISLLVNGNDDAQAVISVSTGYIHEVTVPRPEKQRPPQDINKHNTVINSHILY